MTNSKTTKRALFSSVVALLLCFTMLLGTTFAWFTDSAASGSNVITAGNLDIVVEYTLDGENWDDLDGATDLFQKGLWEPGHTEVVALRIKNNGTLALKYAANMNIVNETVGKTKDGADIVLSDILTVSTVTHQVNQVGDILLGMVFGGSQNTDPGAVKTFKSSNILASDQELLAGDAHYVIITVDMADSVGNEANHNGTDIPTINFGINVMATQFTYENDSFGNDYDANAEYNGALNKNGNVYSLSGDATLTDEVLVSDYTASESYTVNGNGYTVTGIASSIDSFQWTNGTIPAMSNIFSSADGAKVTVNDITFTGTMSAVMLGNYVNSNSNWFNTEFNNVNITNAEVVSFSSNISPAAVVYGTATLNNCNISGTTLSTLDTDPMWPVYDIAVVNYSDTTLNNTKVGSLYMWNQAKVTVGAGSEVEKIVIRGNMNTTNYGLTIEAGASVGVIDLSEITNKTRVNITIEEGAHVSQFFANGVSYSTIADWQAAQ